MKKLPKASLKYCVILYNVKDNELVPFKTFICEHYHGAIAFANALISRGYYALLKNKVIMEKS